MRENLLGAFNGSQLLEDLIVYLLTPTCHASLPTFTLCPNLVSTTSVAGC